MLVLCIIVTCFICIIYHYYAFSGTNLLTRCHSASSLFSAVFVSRKVLLQIFSELHETKGHVPIFPEASRSPKERRRGATRQPDHRPARPHLLPRRRMRWAPRLPSDAALSPIYSPRGENHKKKKYFTRNSPELRRHRNLVSGVRRSCSGTLPGWGLTPRAFSIDATASIMLRE